ncbi:hypothetical protein [Herbaspirillum autotrophicum]|uniref:hypothetical protein n=1 Tax=Herbaspirillum autotrophicum TaxID=180195 RepID=UPI00067CDA5B|nr:hypothetical protein [Herbaspirillum autotrophicum]
MAIDSVSSVSSAAPPVPVVSKAPDPEEARRIQERKDLEEAARKRAEERRAEELQAARAQQTATINANGQTIGTTINTIA